MTLATGTRLGPYEIQSPLGAGGMGEVYLAEDTRLHRKVALKILPAELASNQDRMRRFVQEAESAAALNHPHIAHIYEIGSSPGSSPTPGSTAGQPGWGGTIKEGSAQGSNTENVVHFIAMEFVDGDTLREKIYRDKAPLPKLLGYLNQVAEGLNKAHAAGIVHRDLKPDNIMITRDGYAKILDFGLAKLIEQRLPDDQVSSEAATAVMPQYSRPGTILGTVGYMSPEQAQAKPVDQRSDIFSFGCLLYEAATERQAFVGNSTVDTLHKIIHDPAPSISDLSPAAPSQLQRVIRKCLAKEPAKRYQTIRDTANDLEELIEELKGVPDMERSVAPSASAIESTASASQQPLSSAEYVVSRIKQHKLATVSALVVLVAGLTALGFYLRAPKAEVTIRSIAVMPFVNATGNADAEYLSDGMTETLISSLSQLPNLSVKARSSVFRYKGKATEARTIGTELNVQAILNGRVVQRGDQITLSLELVDAQTENIIWSEQYNRKQTDLVSLQNEIARDVSTKLKTKLSGADEQKLAKADTTNPEAYRLHLQGRFFLDRTTREDTAKAIEYFRQALDLDPGYALCWAELGRAYAVEAGRAWVPEGEGFDRSRAATKHALSLDPDLAEGHALLGRIQATHDLDLRGAEVSYRRALDLAPTSPPVLDGAAVLFYKLGRFDEAVELSRRALVQDPLSSALWQNLGLTYLAAGRLAESEKAFRRALELAPQRIVSNAVLATVLMDQGRDQESLVQAMHEPDEFWKLWALAIIYHGAGRNAESDGALRKLTVEHAAGNAYQIAEVYSMRGEADRAFEWLERAYEKRDSGVTHTKVDPRFQALHGDPRWAPFLKKLGFEA